MTTVLVDGPDGVGKTGYAQHIAETWGFAFVRHEPDGDFGNLPGETIELMAESFNRTIAQFDDADVDMVVDRGPVSSIVYSDVFDRGEPDHAHEILDRLDPLIIYLRCEPRELAIRYDDEKFDNVAEIAEAYEGHMESLSDTYDVVTIDTSSGAPDKIENIMQNRVMQQT